MPRPADTYTHDQFESIDSAFLGDTVRCVHCQQWTGSVKTLNRKKEHLLKCHAYAQWREAGNGHDLAPPNSYTKRDSSGMDDPDPYSSPYPNSSNATQNYNTPAARHRLPDMHKYYDEFWDDSATQKCMRTRCKSCGAGRAKNATRQLEHLQSCQEFLNSAEGQEAVAAGLLDQPTAGQPLSSNSASKEFQGTAPNPNFARPTKPAYRNASKQAQGTPARAPQAKVLPSLINHLLARSRVAIEGATQQPFLSHAGCGTLSPAVLKQFLTQQGHLSRALPTYIGKLIGKLRLTETNRPSEDTSWRAFDLLASTINNAKRELEFLRTTQEKYGLASDREPAKHATKGIIDLMASAAAPEASMLQGMVVLWALEYLYCCSWQYASNFHRTSAPTAGYSLPSYYQQGSQYDMPSSFGGQPPSKGNAHITALHEALIPNWTSAGFGKFVDACKSIVDELANAQTTGNGATELDNCEQMWNQMLWLWKLLWPEVTGMGEEDEIGADGEGEAENGGHNERPIEIQDDEDERDEDAPAADSPYGGTGLGVVAAANMG